MPKILAKIVARICHWEASVRRHQPFPHPNDGATLTEIKEIQYGVRYLIKGGTVYDGEHAEPKIQDIGIKDGVITALGHLSEQAKETIDADGAIVTPAWIDIHTHYDGQVTWDQEMDPSASHGVGTIVMGNCGVGFAPVQTNGAQDLIDLMEGVEDIPGTALHEGMPWGEWSSYDDYLNLLANREYAINISSLVAHGAVRNFVMGERGRDNLAATEDDLKQ